MNGLLIGSGILSVLGPAVIVAAVLALVVALGVTSRARRSGDRNDSTFEDGGRVAETFDPSQHTQHQHHPHHHHDAGAFGGHHGGGHHGGHHDGGGGFTGGHHGG